MSSRTAPVRRRTRAATEVSEWTGEYRRYDIVKEFVIALLALALCTVGLAVLFGSPDEKALSLQDWARNAPNDFVVTAVAELDGSSGTATYGAPYVDDPTAGQKIGPFALQRWAGVREPVDTAQAFVLGPLSTVTGDATLTAALDQYNGAPADARKAWTGAFADALDKAPDNDPAQVATGAYGPVPELSARLLDLARSGGLDGQLLSQGGFYQTNYSKSLLFLADGGYLEDLARGQHLGGDQWGMMNETGNYPGQAWLWLYTFWYQVPPFSTSDNADALVWGLMVLLSALLVLLPFIPGLRSLPRLVPVYRLIWRQHYREQSGAVRPEPGPTGAPSD